MKRIKNGGLELALMNALFPDGKGLPEKDKQMKTFLESLPKNRHEWTSKGYDYFRCQDTGKIYRTKTGTCKLEKLYSKGGKIIIVASIKNKTSGFIHMDIYGAEHYDLYCQRKKEFVFVNEAPY